MHVTLVHDKLLSNSEAWARAEIELASFALLDLETRLNILIDVNFCKDQRDEIEVPDPLAEEDLIS